MKKLNLIFKKGDSAINIYGELAKYNAPLDENHKLTENIRIVITNARIRKPKTNLSKFKKLSSY